MAPARSGSRRTRLGDSFPVLSPDGKKIVFDSNRLRTETEPINLV